MPDDIEQEIEPQGVVPEGAGDDAGGGGDTPSDTIAETGDDPDAEGDSAGKSGDGAEGGAGEGAASEDAAVEGRRSAKAGADQEGVGKQAQQHGGGEGAPAGDDADEVEAAIAPHMDSYRKANQRLEFYKMWEEGKVSQAHLDKYGLKSWDKLTTVEREENLADMREMIAQRKTSAAKVTDLRSSMGETSSAIHGYQRTIDNAITLCQEAGVKPTAEVGDFIVGKMTGKGGVSWATNREQAKKDIAAFAASKGLSAKPNSPPAKGASPGTQVPKKEVVATGGGKGAGGGGGGASAPKAAPSGGFTAEEVALLAEDGIDPKTTTYSKDQLREIINDSKVAHTRSKKLAASAASR